MLRAPATGAGIELFTHLEEKLYTAVVSDALDELGYRNQALRGGAGRGRAEPAGGRFRPQRPHVLLPRARRQRIRAPRRRAHPGQLPADRFGAGGSYTEFYAMDFREGFVLMGHDGPGHLAISDRKPMLRRLALYHGKQGYGVSVEFNVRTGPITIVGLTQGADGRLKLVGAEGDSLPGPILKIGNTNSRLRFRLPPAQFVNRWCEQGPTHHCALGVGRRLAEFDKLSQLIRIPLVQVGGDR